LADEGLVDLNWCSFSSAWNETNQKKTPVSHLRQAFGGQARLWYDFVRSASLRKTCVGQAAYGRPSAAKQVRTLCPGRIADARRGTTGNPKHQYSFLESIIGKSLNLSALGIEHRC
jgi:hypothetical protein